MSNQASERLTKLNDKIMHTWEERTLKEINASVHQKSLALRNSLPEFLEHLAKALSTTIDRTAARVKSDKDESTRISKKHGRERAGMINYTIDQLIFEYHILRQVIFDVIEAEYPLSDIEREVIVCAIEQSVNDAATQFSETLRDVQEKFTHTLAHDLRSPLTSAKMNSQLFLKKPVDLDQAIDVVKRISVSIERIDLMITDLLDAGRMRAGEKLTLDFENCDLEAILKQVTEETNLLYDNRVILKYSGPVVSHCNVSSIRRVFDNLVTNALKFSEPDSPVTIHLFKSEEEIQICVHNFGNPIPADEISILFEQFRRSRTVSEKKGWGLGLVVVKGITEAHGGHIEVESSAEKGTVFKVVLPLIKKN